MELLDLSLPRWVHTWQLQVRSVKGVLQSLADLCISCHDHLQCIVVAWQGAALSLGLGPILLPRAITKPCQQARTGSTCVKYARIAAEVAEPRLPCDASTVR